MGVLMDDKKVILVTGGASGLGQVIVDEFIKLDYKVVFTYLHSKDKANNLVNRYSDNKAVCKRECSEPALQDHYF